MDYFENMASGVCHLGWSSGIGLETENILLLKVSSSILSGINLGGLILLLQKQICRFSNFMIMMIKITDM
jgi:hypothetical protein